MLNSFVLWLDDEVQELHMAYTGNLYESGKHAEAVRIRSKLQTDIMESRISEVVEEICDKYCRFPEAYGDKPDDNKRMMDEKCMNCPLVRLMR